MTARRPAALLLTVFAPLLLAACGGARPGGPPSAPPGTGLRGRTTVDGGCPPARSGSPCPDRPLSARLTITAAGSGTTVAVVTSGTDGGFSLGLPPGDYTVHPADPTGAPAPTAPPVDVTVTAGRVTTVAIVFDSGIR